VRTYYGPGYPVYNAPFINPFLPGPTTYPATTRQFPVSWDWPQGPTGNPPNSDAQGSGTLTLTQVPTEISASGPQQFAATIDGVWKTSGYPVATSGHEGLSLSGSAGSQDTVIATDDQSHNGSINSTATTNPGYGGCCAAGGEARWTITGNIISTGITGSVEVTLYYSG
jgi:hypothetical protein